MPHGCRKTIALGGYGLGGRRLGTGEHRPVFREGRDNMCSHAAWGDRAVTRGRQSSWDAASALLFVGRGGEVLLTLEFGETLAERPMHRAVGVAAER